MSLAQFFGLRHTNFVAVRFWFCFICSVHLLWPRASSFLSLMVWAHLPVFFGKGAIYCFWTVHFISPSPFVFLAPQAVAEAISRRSGERAVNSPSSVSFSSIPCPDVDAVLPEVDVVCDFLPLCMVWWCRRWISVGGGTPFCRCWLVHLAPSSLPRSRVPPCNFIFGDLVVLVWFWVSDHVASIWFKGSCSSRLIWISSWIRTP